VLNSRTLRWFPVRKKNQEDSSLQRYYKAMTVRSSLKKENLIETSIKPFLNDQGVLSLFRRSSGVVQLRFQLDAAGTFSHCLALRASQNISKLSHASIRSSHFQTKDVEMSCSGFWVNVLQAPISRMTKLSVPLTKLILRLVLGSHATVSAMQQQNSTTHHIHDDI